MAALVRISRASVGGAVWGSQKKLQESLKLGRSNYSSLDHRVGARGALLMRLGTEAATHQNNISVPAQREARSFC